MKVYNLRLVQMYSYDAQEYARADVVHLSLNTKFLSNFPGFETHYENSIRQINGFINIMSIKGCSKHTFLIFPMETY